MPKPRTAVPRCAMILAAGFGTRMRPLTDKLPKPLVPVGGQPVINHVLDRLAGAGVETAVVNVHHFADQIEQHLKPRRAPKIVISDERDSVLGTGGGVVKALPLLGAAPFFHLNSDTLWIDGVKSNPERLAAAVRPPPQDAPPLPAAPPGWLPCCCLPGPRPASATAAAAISRWRRTASCAGARSARWFRSSTPASRSCRRRCLPTRPPAPSRSRCYSIARSSRSAST